MSDGDQALELERLPVERQCCDASPNISREWMCWKQILQRSVLALSYPLVWRFQMNDSDYTLLNSQVRALLADEADALASASNFVALLNDAIDDINWLGIYVMRGDELVLGPFQGKTRMRSSRAWIRRLRHRRRDTSHSAHCRRSSIRRAHRM